MKVFICWVKFGEWGGGMENGSKNKIANKVI